MATDASIIDASITYIRLETIANIFIVLQSFALIGLITLGKEKLVYLITFIKLILCLIFDIFLVSTLPCSLNLSLNSIALSNIIVNFILLIITIILLYKNEINIFNK